MMHYLTATILSVPFVVSFLLICLHRYPERWLAILARFGAKLYAFSAFAAIAYWFYLGRPTVHEDLLTFGVGHFSTIHLGTLWNAVSVIYLGLTAFCCLCVMRFSRYYMHREAGYGRYFAVLFALIGGISLLSLADNLDVFFAGWEVIGLASFLLVSFYHRRAVPVGNALKIFSVYRVGDLGLLLGVWLTHLAPQDGVHLRFNELASLLDGAMLHQEVLFVPLAIALIIAATAKSAQFPFSFWMPKAMEGPTPSSAIFYGALSVHAGVLLLIRTEAIWFPYMSLRLVIGSLGLAGAVFATVCGRTQSSIKGQLAYASVTQVGLMFVELALGLHSFVLYHMCAHALLRSFQILVSPSIIVDAMHAPNSSRILRAESLERYLPRRLRTSLYVLAIQDGYLEYLLRNYVVGAFERIASPLRTIFAPLAMLAVVSCAGFMLIGGERSSMLIFGVCLFIQYGCALIALFEKRSAVHAINYVGLGLLAAGLSVMSFDEHLRDAGLLFLSVSMSCWFFVRAMLLAIPLARVLPLDGFRGLVEVYRTKTWLLLLGCCILAGVPPSPVFYVEDVLLHSVASVSGLSALVVGLSFSINGLALIRTVALLGFGPLRLNQANPEIASQNSVMPLGAVLPSGGGH